MNAEELRAKLTYSRARLAAANEAKERAERLSAEARELGGGLLGFGGSGPQGAKRKVQGAQSRAFEAHRDADERIKLWSGKISSLERRIAEIERPRFTRDDLVGVTHIRDDIRWRKVVKLNAKTVSVETGYSWVDRVSFDKIREYRTIAVS
jgi:hypothetical protein